MQLRWHRHWMIWNWLCNTMVNQKEGWQLGASFLLLFLFRFCHRHHGQTNNANLELQQQGCWAFWVRYLPNTLKYIIKEEVGWVGSPPLPLSSAVVYVACHRLHIAFLCCLTACHHHLCLVLGPGHHSSYSTAFCLLLFVIVMEIENKARARNIYRYDQSTLHTTCYTNNFNL